MIAFANGPQFGTDQYRPRTREEEMTLKFRDKLRALADVGRRSSSEVVHLSSNRKMHGGKELIGETDIHFIVWLWRGPGDYEVSMEPRPGATFEPPERNGGGEVPERAAKEAADESPLSKIATGIKAIADAVRRLLRKR